jgi:transcriptional regulator with GAF, ATPase, and Fis domain
LTNSRSICLLRDRDAIFGLDFSDQVQDMGIEGSAIRASLALAAGVHVGRVCTLAEAEREHISEVVEMTNGLIAGKGGAAEALGVPPSTLRNRMKKLGIRS